MLEQPIRNRCEGFPLTFRSLTQHNAEWRKRQSLRGFFRNQWITAILKGPHRCAALVNALGDNSGSETLRRDRIYEWRRYRVREGLMPTRVRDRAGCEALRFGRAPGAQESRQGSQMRERGNYRRRVNGRDCCAMCPAFRTYITRDREGRRRSVC